MKKSIKYLVLLVTPSFVPALKSCEAPDHAGASSPSINRTVNPVATAADPTVTSVDRIGGSSNTGETSKSKKSNSLTRAVAFELPALQFKRRQKTTITPDRATVVEWNNTALAGRPRRASSFSDLRELAESTQARLTPGVHRSVKVMLVPEPIDLSAQADSFILEMGDTNPAESKSIRATHTAPKLTRTDSRLALTSDTVIPVGAPKSTVVTTSSTTIDRTYAGTHGHDPLVLALAASLKTYTEQNSEFLRNQAEQNRVATEERNTTRRGVRDAKIIGTIATVGTLVGPYVAPYITAWVKSWI
ncbi:MAG TPA: hypothetical protein VJJ81_03250 [Candidatus Babeliales bacterium]|nr:hypothetical protein [Candidatus Babeliales bacterium]